MENKAKERRLNWIKRNGFSEETESTYVYIGADSYERKDELKAAGWKYHPLVGWHNGELNIEASAENIYLLLLKDAVEFAAWGEGSWKQSIQATLDAAKEAALPATESEWIAEKGEMVRNLPVVLESKRQCCSLYGLSNIIKIQ